ncbi:methyltransferase [Archaeoglobus sp.]
MNRFKEECGVDYLVNEPSISPKPLYEILNECSRTFKVFCVLYTALKMGVFDCLSKPKTLAELCEETKANPDFMDKICKILVDLGFLVEENGFYKNSEISDVYLRRNSPLNQRSVFEDLRNNLKLWERLEEIAKSGPITIGEERFFKEHNESLASRALCGELQRTVKIISSLPEFKKARRLLDLGGGHGLYAIAFTKLNPNLEAYVFDFPEVLEKTKENISKFKAERVNVIAGNFFTDDIGEGYDIVFFSYNPGGRNPKLIPKIHASLKDGGIFVNKHVFHCKGEGTKSPLLDIEWCMVAWSGVKKASRIYSFEGNTTFEEYLEVLKKYFSIVKIVDAHKFAGYALTQLGDTLDAKIIVAKKI